MIEALSSGLSGFSPAMIILLAAIGILVGVFIGGIGIGGVLLVPALVYLAGYDIHIAIASCMLSYAFSGLVGAWMYTRKGTIRWTTGGWLSIGAMPGAASGALLVQQLSVDAVTLVIALFIAFAAYSSSHKTPAITAPATSKPLFLVSIGLLVGIGSAISGTGGPLLLVPVLVWYGWPVLGAVGLSQLIQIPIALLATASNLYYGTIDVFLGLAIAVVITLGVVVGASVAHALPVHFLRKLVIIALILVAAWMLLRATSGIFPGLLQTLALPVSLD